MPRWTLALGGSDHDPSAALACDTDIRVAIEQERLSRCKHGAALWYESPVQRSIDYCSVSEGISLDEIGLIVASDTLPASVRHSLRHHSLLQFPHHLCHAASAYMMLPPGTRAGVIVYDGFGSICGPAPGEPLRNLRETFSFFIFGPHGYRRLGCTTGLGFVELDEFPVGVTNSVGMLYELVTAVLGYDVMDSGKTMGLAAHGSPRYLASLEEFVTYGDDPGDCFRCATDSPALVEALHAILWEKRGSFAVRADLAASVQAVVDKTLLHCLQFLGNEIDHLCLSGGSALNTVATSFLIQHSPLKVPITCPPHCGDAGLGLGALWLEEHERTGDLPQFTFRGNPVNPGLARPGRVYSGDERRRAVQDFYPRLSFDPSVTGPEDLARVLAEGEIVGVLNGRSEIGPRALGGRSILADPRSPAIRERLNRSIKRREPFRPLAPLLLRSQYSKYFFEERCADPFMLKVAQARECCLRDAPAAVHIDGTARVQVVPDDGDPFLIALLESFQNRTGVGILLNTSFNRRGEPIVETPSDAVDAFLGTGLDGLYLDGEFYRSAVAASPSD